jgi:phosphohistidine phosphatase
VELLLIRHATAVERGEGGFADDERPLTPEGEKKFRRAAQGLARIQAKPDAILASPLPRAHQTAEIAAAAWGDARVTKTPALESGSFEELETALAGYAENATVALVGHEPHMSELLARLLASRNGGALAFKKGGAALVEVPGRLAQGGQLVWFIPPRVLRELGG